MKRIYILIISFVLLLPITSLFAQDTVAKDNKTLVYTEKIPEYPGGKKALYKFLYRNFKTPKSVDDDGLSGEARIGFTIDTTGMPCNFKVIQSFQVDFDNEVIRVLKLMPRWVPGEQFGKKVAVECTVPVKIQARTKKRKNKKSLKRK